MIWGVLIDHYIMRALSFLVELQLLCPVLVYLNLASSLSRDMAILAGRRKAWSGV